MFSDPCPPASSDVAGVAEAPSTTTSSAKPKKIVLLKDRVSNQEVSEVHVLCRLEENVHVVVMIYVERFSVQEY